MLPSKRINDGLLRKPPASAVAKFTQFQHVNGSGQFRDWAKEVVLWPPEYKSGDIIYPYAAARK